MKAVKRFPGFSLRHAFRLQGLQSYKEMSQGFSGVEVVIQRLPCLSERSRTGSMQSFICMLPGQPSAACTQSPLHSCDSSERRACGSEGVECKVQLRTVVRTGEHVTHFRGSEALLPEIIESV